jgi:hypothetical protein
MSLNDRLISQEEECLAILRDNLSSLERLRTVPTGGLKQRIAVVAARIKALQQGAYLASRT